MVIGFSWIWRGLKLGLKGIEIKLGRYRNIEDKVFVGIWWVRFEKEGVKGGWVEDVFLVFDSDNYRIIGIERWGYRKKIGICMLFFIILYIVFCVCMFVLVWVFIVI